MPEVKIEKIPHSIEEFIELRNQKSTTPEGGAAMFLLALKIYIENPNLGEQFLVLSIAKRLLVKGNTYKGYALGNSDQYLLNQLKKYPYVPNSYIKGSTPENNYTVKLPFIYEFEYQRYSGDPNSGEVKIFVYSSGADTPRPITMLRNEKGIWKAYNWSSVVVSVRKPASEIEEDDL